MLTAHRPSFPTCLLHPRSIHLLCHLDSPSAANLPCLGLQQQTGPEVSGLCDSYRVPSRSPLLPLRTLSPGENRSQANKPHTVQYCVVTTTHGENRHRLSQTSSAITERSHGHGFGTEPPRTGSISRIEDAHGLSKTTWDF
jgi:hypothetical protein